VCVLAPSPLTFDISTAVPGQACGAQPNVVRRAPARHRCTWIRRGDDPGCWNRRSAAACPCFHSRRIRISQRDRRCAQQAIHVRWLRLPTLATHTSTSWGSRKQWRTLCNFLHHAQGQACSRSITQWVALLNEVRAGLGGSCQWDPWPDGEVRSDLEGCDVGRGNMVCKR